MRILHVGFGFRPWVVNGLLIYCESVMDGQVDRGHEVAYFFTGRQLPLIRRPFLHRWQRRRIQMFEWVNSDLIVGSHRGTPTPEHDLDHPPSEAAFRRVLREFSPDLVHVHDLGGLPSSLLDIARKDGRPVVMTIHDYHPVCPTVKLYDAHDRICLRPDPGEMCAVCCADAPEDNEIELANTLWYARQQLRRSVPGLDAALARTRTLSRAGARVIDRVGGVGPGAPGARATQRAPRAPASAYQRRRDVNLERLNRLDALVASSRRSAEIYRTLGVTEAPIELAPINPPHIEQLRPSGSRRPDRPVRFAVLNACSSTQKGADLLVQALAELSSRGLEDRFGLFVYGSVAPQAEAPLQSHGSVELRGHYRVEDLGELLRDVDVGLLPSVWEEVYGFVGLEFLAAGIPVIGNQVGAIPEHVRPGETGWLNRSCSATELADLMAGAIESPDEVRALAENLMRCRGKLIESFEMGLTRLGGVYERVLAEQARG
jgi:glycosyltransferase involved in cell wall biosynthesis